MIDVWRHEHPKKREYSGRQVVLNKLKQSCIDLCIASQGIVSFIRSRDRFTAFSDHAILSFHMGLGIEGRGGGFWCINSCILEENNYRKKIVNFLKSEYVNGMLDLNAIQWWEMIKEKIKRIFIFLNRGNGIKREENILEKNWKRRQRKLILIHCTVLIRLCTLKKGLDALEIEKCRVAIIRSKALFATEGGKCMSFFLNLE